jgi:hypothetical protein
MKPKKKSYKKKNEAKGYSWDNGSVAFGTERKKGAKYNREKRITDGKVERV